MKTGIYRHYRGHVYRVMFIGKHTETLENMVVYQAINAKIPVKNLHQTKFGFVLRRCFWKMLSLMEKTFPDLHI